MPELAARPLILAVVVEMETGNRQQGCAVRPGADDIDHRRMALGRSAAQGCAHEGADMVLELAGGGAFDGPMAAVVHPRCQLVDHEAVMNLEEFDGEGADIGQFLQQAAGQDLGLALQRRRGAGCRRAAEMQDAAAV